MEEPTPSWDQVHAALQRQAEVDQERLQTKKDLFNQSQLGGTTYCQNWLAMTCECWRKCVA